MLTFTFTVNDKTGEAVFAGNINPMEALKILQDIAINDIIKNSQVSPVKEVTHEPV